MQGPSPNPVWRALTTAHRALAIGDGRAWRYPAAVAPFVAIDDPSPSSGASAAALVAPGEAVYFAGAAPDDLGAWELLGTSRIVQMHWDGNGLDGGIALPPSGSLGTPRAEGRATEIVELAESDRDAMLALTAVAFPGFFRASTPTLGRYVGVRPGGALVAMAGERMAWPGFREVSAVCTHPEHVGRGYAAALSLEVMRGMLARGERPFLHATVGNDRAIRLYERLGFTTRLEIPLWHVRRAAS
jgi:ribosomal protein S18 acetylase RimI-like enzyme